MFSAGATWLKVPLLLALASASIAIFIDTHPSLAADPLQDCKNRYDSTQRGDGTYVDQRYSACERGTTAAINNQDAAQSCSGFGDQVLTSECTRAHQYAKNNNVQAPPQAPTHPCEDRYDRDADGSFRRRDACKAGYDYANGDYSKECGDMGATPLDPITQICVEGYNLNPNKQTPYPSRDYKRDILNTAPRGYVLPGERDTVVASRNAQLFCNYYNTPEETRFQVELFYLSCITGYELGFGKGSICTERFLFGPKHLGYPYPNATSEKISGLSRQYGYVGNRSAAVPLAIAACQDGWTQYKVDYWYCGNSTSCRDALRIEKKRIIDPGPAPTRERNLPQGAVVDPTRPTPGAIVMQTGNPTQSCGSIQTAYFSCGGGGDDIQSSSFWQILQIILNILLAIVGITAVGGMVYGAVRYSAAQDNASEVNAARNIIKNVIIGLVLYLIMWAAIEYMIPGGILR